MSASAAYYSEYVLDPWTAVFMFSPLPITFTIINAWKIFHSRIVMWGEQQFSLFIITCSWIPLYWIVDLVSGYPSPSTFAAVVAGPLSWITLLIPLAFTVSLTRRGSRMARDQQQNSQPPADTE